MVHLARGATPKAIMEVMNRLSKESPEILQTTYRLPSVTPEGQDTHSWVSISGTREIDLRDVRRVYDRMRKTAANFEQQRKDSLAYFRNIDSRNKAIAPVTKLKYPSTRRMHDLGFARRFGADRDLINKLAGKEEVPFYLYDKSERHDLEA